MQIFLDVFVEHRNSSTGNYGHGGSSFQVRGTVREFHVRVLGILRILLVLGCHLEFFLPILFQ